MTAVGVARSVLPYTLGFDVFEPVTHEMLYEAIGHGFGFVGQYLNNLTPQTRDIIFAANLGILLYTEAMTSEPLTAQTGRVYGDAMVMSSDQLSVAAGVHVAIDLELPKAGSDVPAHVDAMAGELLSGRLGAALYVGIPQPLTSAELYALRPDRYIKGAGRIVDAQGQLAEPRVGWCALQLEPLEGLMLAGVKVDVAVSKVDYLGRALTLWWPS